MKKQLVAFSVALFVIVAVVGGSVQAQSDTTEDTPTDNTQSNTTQTEQRQERQVQRVLERCDRITERLTNHIGRVNRATEQQVGVYERLNGRLDLIIATANEVQYDSTDLIAARDAIGEKIALFTQAATAATAQLTEAANTACDEEVTAYGTALVASRTNLTAVREAAQDVRQTFREEAIPALQSFAAWLEVNESTEEEV
jgi:hypothetical protein